MKITREGSYCRYASPMGGRSPRLLIACVSLASVFCESKASAASVTDVALRQAENLKQQQAQQQQMQAASAPATDEPPETYPGENKDLGPQLLLKQKPKAKPLFEFSSDTMFTWSSNALSERAHPQEAGIVAETLSLAFAPEAVEVAGGKLSLRAGYRHLFWMYDIARTKGAGSTTAQNGYNFEMSSFFASGSFAFNENWNASLGLDYNRILTDQEVSDEPAKWRLWRMGNPSKWTETYTEWNPNWSLSRNIPLGDKLSLSLAYNGGFHFTTTDGPPGSGYTHKSDKLDSGISATLMYSVTDKFLISPNVRFTQNLYTQPQARQSTRHDRSLNPGVNFMWNPSPRWSVRASVSAEFKHSNDPDTQSYSKFDISPGVSLTLKF